MASNTPLSETESPNVCILVLSGLPASGKSTLAKKLTSLNLKTKLAAQDNGLDLKNVQRFGFGVENIPQPQPVDSDKLTCRYFVKVSYDDLIPEDVEAALIHSSIFVGEEGNSDWKTTRTNILKCVDSLIHCLQFSKSLVKGKGIDGAIWGRFKDSIMQQVDLELDIMEYKVVTIVIDDNMYYRSMRYNYYQLARKYCLGYCQVHLNCTEQVAKAQNAERSQRRVPDDVITAMVTKMEIPNPDLYHWETLSLFVNFDSIDEAALESINGMIMQAVHNPVQPVIPENTEEQEKSRQICSANHVHQADQILRRLVGSTIASVKSNNPTKLHMKDMASKCTSVRTKILQDMRTGAILVDRDLDPTDSSKSEDHVFYKFIADLFNCRYFDTGVT